MKPFKVKPTGTTKKVKIKYRRYKPFGTASEEIAKGECKIRVYADGRMEPIHPKLEYEDIEEEIDVPVYIPYAHSERLKHAQVCKAFRDKIDPLNKYRDGKTLIVHMVGY